MLRALRSRRDPKRALRRALGDFKLPVFPAAVLKSLAAVRDPKSSPRRIEEAVSLDPGLSSRILTRVNSPAFGCRREVQSLRHATTLLGRGPIESLLVSIGVQRVMPSRAARGFDPKAFWAAAGRRAAIAGELAGVLHPRTRTESVTAALLQDMALPFLATSGPEGYGELLESTGGGSHTLHSAERNAFGWDHAEVAGWLCETWHFPGALASGIAGHHGTDASAPRAVRLVAFLDDRVDPRGSEGLDALVAELESSHEMSADRAVELVTRGLDDADRAA